MEQAPKNTSQYDKRTYSHVEELPLAWGEKIYPRPQHQSIITLILRLILALISTACAIRMIVTYLPTRDTFTFAFGISLLLANVAFYAVSKYFSFHRTTRRFAPSLTVAFISTLVLVLFSGLFPTQTIAALFLLICIWLALLCINLPFLLRKRRYSHSEEQVSAQQKTLSPRPTRTSWTALVLRLVLLLLSIVCGMGMIITYLPTRDTFMAVFGVSLLLANAAFYAVSKYFSSHRTTRRFASSLTVAFISTLVLVLFSGLFPTQTLASLLLLIGIWLGLLCINLPFLLRKG